MRTPHAPGTIVLVRGHRGACRPAVVDAVAPDGSYTVTPLGGYTTHQVTARDVLDVTFRAPATAEDVLHILAGAMGNSASGTSPDVRDIWYAAADEVRAILRSFPRAFDRAVSGDDANRRIKVTDANAVTLAAAPRHRLWVDLRIADMERIDADALIAEAPSLPWFFDLETDDSDAINGEWTGKIYVDDGGAAVYMYQDGPETLAVVRFIEAAAWHWPRDRRIAQAVRNIAATIPVNDGSRCESCDRAGCRVRELAAAMPANRVDQALIDAEDDCERHSDWHAKYQELAAAVRLAAATDSSC